MRIIELKEYCVSMKLAARLKELGYPQEGLFWWKQSQTMDIYTLAVRESSAFAVKPAEFFAPTPGEIIVFLKENGLHNFNIFKFGNLWRFSIGANVASERFHTFADACGGILIECLAKGIVKV